ncbi:MULTISPECIES: DUF4058 family protein [unclassified Nostoc]|uniref:DUF4058 family protein n=1 Tax=Nostoc sp. S13 TaxID=3019266 RepID=UPI00262055BB|nr:DUF4058 family protein [Nostoc sp. S13]MDF5738485.1 DUF4058 family protein [Nostoc sp. S13]
MARSTWETNSSDCRLPLSSTTSQVKNRQTVTDSINTNVAVAAPTPEPIKVKIPMPVSIREGYLEVREVGTETLVTTI